MVVFTTLNGCFIAYIYRSIYNSNNVKAHLKVTIIGDFIFQGSDILALPVYICKRRWTFFIYDKKQ